MTKSWLVYVFVVLARLHAVAASAESDCMLQVGHQVTSNKLTPITLTTGCEDTTVIVGDQTPGNAFQVKVKNPATGRCRQCSVRLPSDYDSAVSWPMVLDFHGSIDAGMVNIKALTLAGKSLDDVHWQTYGLDLQDGSVEDFKFVSVACYAEVHSRGMGWDGTMGWELWDCAGGCTGDVDFVRKMVTVLQEEFSIDPARIFASGHSSGGAFMFRLAYEANDIFRALAPRAGRMRFNQQWNPWEVVDGALVVNNHQICMPFIYQIAGQDTRDPMGKPNCQPRAEEHDETCTVMSLQASIMKIAEANGCTVDVANPDELAYNRLIGNGQPKTEETFGGNDADVYDFPGCRDGSKVEYYEWTNEGHSFTNANQETLKERLKFFAKIATSSVCGRPPAGYPPCSACPVRHACKGSGGFCSSGGTTGKGNFFCYDSGTYGDKCTYDCVTQDCPAGTVATSTSSNCKRCE